MTGLRTCNREFNARRGYIATVSKVLMGLWRVYDPTRRAQEGHLLPVWDPQRPERAAFIWP